MTIQDIKNQIKNHEVWSTTLKQPKSSISLSREIGMRGLAYSLITKHDIIESREQAVGIVKDLQQEIDTMPTAWYANKKRTWADTYIVGFAPADLERCDFSEMAEEAE